MKKLRKLIARYEKIFLIGLVLIVLVIFTVTGDILAWLQGTPEGYSAPDERAGSFQVLPGRTTYVTWRDFRVASNDLRLALGMQLGQRGERIRDIDVWTYLVQREAARQEGITVSNAQLVATLRKQFGAEFLSDRARYKGLVQQYFKVTTRQFEEAVREVLTAERVRSLYQQSYLVAPPAPRSDVIQQYTAQNIEYVRGTYAAYPARLELDAARAEYKADAEPGKTLKEFFEKDPTVRNERILFQHPRTYKHEVIYVVHKHVFDPKRYQLLEDLFFKAYPDLPRRLLEPKVGEMKEFFRLYKERILAMFPGWEEQSREIRKAYLEELRVRDKETEKAVKEAYLAELLAKDVEGAPRSIDELSADDEELQKRLAAADWPSAPKTVEELDDVSDAELQKRLHAAGWDVAKEQVEHEIRVRFMLWQLRDSAAKDATKSLKETFDRLAKLDDPENPICSTEPDKGILVFRDFSDGLSGDELSDLEDSGVRFTVNYRHRVTSMGTDDLPRLHPKAETAGSMADLRVVIRLIDVEEPRRKTFSELTEGDKEDLLEEFYLPEKSRQRAKEKLAAHRKKLMEGEIPAEELRESVLRLDPTLKAADAIESSRVRVHENEWITASYDLMAEPQPKLYWHREYLHMRDRNFLHRELAVVLGRDRVKKELGPGSYLEILLDARGDEEEDDVGTAYLVLLLERRSPNAETMPPDEFNSFISFSRRARASEERRRWSGDFANLKNTFRMEFYGGMQDRIEDELNKIDEAKRTRAQG